MDSPHFARITRELALRKRLQESLLVFAKGVSARLSPEPGLEALAQDVNVLFGTGRVSVWIHDRRARTLRLAASSDVRDADAASSLSTEEDSVIARGLRQEGAHMSGSGAAQVLTAPLRGWRRALGTLVIEGHPREVDDEQLVDLSMSLARQLSVAIESVIVLDELIRQHRLLEDTFDSLADMVVVVDSRQRTVQLNSALASRLGAKRSDLIDQPLERVVGPVIANWTEAQGAERANVASREFMAQPLAEALAATATPFVSQAAGSRGQVLVLRDISEQLRLRQRVAQAEKLSSLGQFIAGIAHEMNNPLQGLLGHLELMLDDKRHSASHAAEIRRAFDDADRAAKIVRSLLVFSGSQRAVRKCVDVEELLSRVIAMREGALQRPGDIRFERTGQLGLPNVNGDSGLLQQALLNVLINAEQASGERGQPGLITLSTSVEQRTIVITIADNGPGIPAEILPRIFDPFFTTKEVGEGTGLGLAITYGIVQDHGGSISAASTPEGAVFTLCLPVAE